MGISGSHLMQPFQCDTCWFRNIMQRFPSSSSYKDTKLLAYIRRVNLDLIWSRSEGTSYMSSYKKALKIDMDLGLTPTHYMQGP